MNNVVPRLTANRLIAETSGAYSNPGDLVVHARSGLCGDFGFGRTWS